MQFVKNVLVYVFGIFTFGFCYSFYEGFIHKIILINLFLPFICISYPLKVFKLDTEILRDSCAVSLLKSSSRLPWSIAVLCPILFLMFACNNYPFCPFVIMIYWTSTEVLLSLVDPLVLAVPSFDFEQINVFVSSGFDSVSISFDSLSIAEVSLNCISIQFRCPFFWRWENQYMVYCFDSISIAQFPAIICSV